MSTLENELSTHNHENYNEINLPTKDALTIHCEVKQHAGNTDIAWSTLLLL